MQTPTIQILRASLIAAITAAMTSGCMTTRVEESKDAATGLDADDAIVILASSYHAADPAEDTFIECVSKKIQRGKRGIPVHSEGEFRDILFPWLEPRTAPQKVEDLPDLLARPGVAKRIADTDVRYIVWIQGDTEQTNSGGSLSCAAGPGGAGCFGLAWWEDEAVYEATIWDLQEGVSAGKVSANVNGTSVIPAVVIPVPMIARTRTAACKGLSQQLTTFISGST